MTGQSLLNLMEVVDNELQGQTGEDDVVRALIALNAAQDYFESLIAYQPRMMGNTTGTVTTSASTETTTFPSGLLRVDKLQFIDPSTSKPSYDLENLRRTGGHIRGRGWPFNLIYSNAVTSGRPAGYWENGRSIYWAPLPDATYTIRWYGFSSASDITAGGTFAYPDICALPLAIFATKLMGQGVGDQTIDLSEMAAATFGPTIQTLANHNRDGAVPFEYTRIHTI